MMMTNCPVPPEEEDDHQHCQESLFGGGGWHRSGFKSNNMVYNVRIYKCMPMWVMPKPSVLCSITWCHYMVSVCMSGDLYFQCGIEYMIRGVSTYIGIRAANVLYRLEDIRSA